MAHGRGDPLHRPSAAARSRSRSSSRRSCWTEERCVLCARCTSLLRRDRTPGVTSSSSCSSGEPWSEVAIYEDEPCQAIFPQRNGVPEVCPVGRLTLRPTSPGSGREPFDLVLHRRDLQPRSRVRLWPCLRIDRPPGPDHPPAGPLATSTVGRGLEHDRPGYAASSRPVAGAGADPDLAVEEGAPHRLLVGWRCAAEAADGIRAVVKGGRSAGRRPPGRDQGRRRPSRSWPGSVFGTNNVDARTWPRVEAAAAAAWWPGRGPTRGC